MKGSLKHNYETHNRPLDTVMTWQVLVPCVIMAVIAHPQTSHDVGGQWCCGRRMPRYLEAVSVLPQLRVMQSAKNCGKMDGKLCVFVGRGEVFELRALDFANFRRAELFENGVDFNRLWPVMVLVSEIVQTFILADFCYFYVLSFCRRREGCPVTSWFSITFLTKH